MRYPLSTPDELSEEPELAPLVILQAAAEVSRRALLAAHPELLSRDVADQEPEISPRQCFAAGLLSALGALEEAIGRYCVHLDHLAARRSTTTRKSDDIPL